MEENDVIIIENLNKKYRSGHGINNISFKIQSGKVLGFLGPNGSGKTTTIRTILGFIKSNSGSSTIINPKESTHLVEKIIQWDSWIDRNKIQRIIGYVPGEIAFPEFMTGTNLLKIIFKLRKMKNWNDVKKYITFWEFNPNMKIKKMSKGMKQKLALCIAWMHNPDIFILDEPTAGLDPIMQEKFLNLIKIAKNNNKAILISSHIFSEIEKICDNVAIIKQGKIISELDINEIKYNREKTYEIMFASKISKEFLNSKLFITKEFFQNSNTIIVEVKNDNINLFLKLLSEQNILFLKEHPLNLEQYFMKYYENENEIFFLSNSEVETIKQDKSKISFELIKYSVKKNLFLWCFLTCLLLFVTIISFVAMDSEGYYDNRIYPSFVISIIINNAVSMILIVLAYLIIVIYVVISPITLIVAEVERGTILNFLATRQSRKSILITKMLTFNVFLLTTLLLEAITMTASIYSFGIENFIDFDKLIIGFLGLDLLLFLVGSIGMFFSCFYNKISYSLACTGSLVVVSWILTLVSDTPGAEWLRFLSLNTLFRFNSIESVTDFNNYLAEYIFMGITGIGLNILSYYVFTRKDLHI